MMAMRAIQMEFKEESDGMRTIFPRKVAFEMTRGDGQ